MSPSIPAKAWLMTHLQVRGIWLIRLKIWSVTKNKFQIIFWTTSWVWSSNIFLSRWLRLWQGWRSQLHSQAQVVARADISSTFWTSHPKEKISTRALKSSENRIRVQGKIPRIDLKKSKKDRFQNHHDRSTIWRVRWNQRKNYINNWKSNNLKNT